MARMGTKLTVPTEVVVGVLGQFSFHSGLAAHEEAKPPENWPQRRGSGPSSLQLFAILIKHFVFSLIEVLKIALDGTCRESAFLSASFCRP